MQAVSIMLTRSIKYRTPEILINYTYYLIIEYLLHIRYNKHNMLFLKKKKNPEWCYYPCFYTEGH